MKKDSRRHCTSFYLKTYPLCSFPYTGPDPILENLSSTRVLFLSKLLQKVYQFPESFISYTYSIETGNTALHSSVGFNRVVASTRHERKTEHHRVGWQSFWLVVASKKQDGFICVWRMEFYYNKFLVLSARLGGGSCGLHCRDPRALGVGPMFTAFRMWSMMKGRLDDFRHEKRSMREETGHARGKEQGFTLASSLGCSSVKGFIFGKFSYHNMMHRGTRGLRL